MKLKLDNEMLAEMFFEDVHLFGIMASIKSYQFVWHINKQLGYSFRLNNDLEIERRNKSRSFFFSIYEYRIPLTSMSYYIYHNQNDGEFLLPELKNLDFLWMIKGDDISSQDISSLQQTIKSLPNVLLVNEVASDKIKNKQHLIF
jgi:hypothetical protein